MVQQEQVETVIFNVAPVDAAEQTKNVLVFGLAPVFEQRFPRQLLTHPKLEEAPTASVAQAYRVEIVVSPPAARLFEVLAADLEREIVAEQPVETNPGFAPLQIDFRPSGSAAGVEFVLAEHFGF
jgi:hypothetical protein